MNQVHSLSMNPKTAPSLMRKFVLSPVLDFWLLGGLSILVCIAMHFGNSLKGEFAPLQVRFLQLGVLFSVLSLVCNHPHFMISYSLGYGRGRKFIFSHWITLIAIPIAMLGAFLIAFLKYDLEIPGFRIPSIMNHFFSLISISTNFGSSSILGDEILELSIWIMYLTVGWHYAKQVYGCMMVYARFGNYKLSSKQCLVLKWSTFSVAAYQFVYIANLMSQYSVDGQIQDSRFQGIQLSAIGFPNGAVTLLGFMVSGFALLSCLIFLKNYLETKSFPPVNLIVPWIAFHVWWIPIGNLPEYYLLMIPFFHSLQYLPFAFRVDLQKFKLGFWHPLFVFLNGFVLLAIGFLAFELVPTFLDSSISMSSDRTPLFFVTTFAVFINIHHFFIDSVVWKLKDQTVRTRLLFQN